MLAEKTSLNNAAWPVVHSDDELIENLKIALREGEKCFTESLRAIWLNDAKLIKIELRKRGINWLKVIK